MKTSARCILPLLGSIAFLVPAKAADVSKANNVTPLNTGGSWVGNNAPTATDVAVWDATVPAANTTQLGGSVSWQGIRVSNPGGTIIAADAGSANTLTLGVGGVDMSAAIRALQIQSRISLSGNQTWNVADAVPGVNTFGFNFSEDLSFAAQVAGALFDGGGFAVTKLGPGTAVISSGYTIDNTVFNVDAGTLIFSGAAGRTVNINTGVTVNVNTGATFRMQGASGATNYNGTLNLNGGTVLLTSSNANNAPSVNGPVHVNNASTILLANPMASAVSGPIVINGNLDGSAPLNITNTTTTTTFLRLGGDNSAYSGTVTFGGDPGHAARFTNSTAGSAAATWVVNADQTLELDGVDVQFGTLNGGGTITNSSTAVASSITVGAGNFTGSVIDGTLPMAVTKVGAGTLELIGANSFSGATTVQGGTLLMSPATVGVTNVTVADGAAFGVKLLSAGTTLTLSNVTVGSSAGGGVVFDLGTFGNPTVAPLNVTTFTPVAPTTLRISGANLANGTFPLLDYAGAIGGLGLAGVNVVLPPRVVGSLVNNAGSTRLDLNITGKDFPKWTGATNANWDIDNGQGGGTINWREVTSGNVTKYLQNASGSDSVLFDDTANPAGTTVNLTTLLQPTAVTVNNSALNFTFGGVGKLSGSTGLAKSGTGTLILSNTGGNDYTGATMISAGTLQIGDGATPGGGTLGTAAVTNDGTLALNRPDDFTLANAISGIGALVKSSAATATLTGVVNLSGGITINAGVLRFNSGGTLNGPIAGPGALHSGGGTLLLSGSNPNTFTGDIVVSTGVLQLGKTAGTNAVGGNIVITGNGLLQLIDAEQIPNGATVTYSSDGPLNPLGNETIANAIVTGPAGPGQLVGNNGLEITNTLSISGRIFSVASGHESTANRVNLSGGILRIAANQGASTLNVGAGGIVISGGAIQVGEGTGAFDAVLNLGGDFTATSNIDITRGGATETLRREINLGAGNRTFNIAAGTRTIVRPEVAGPGGLIKLGEGILEFLGINSYAGDTIVNRGTVITSTAQTGTANLVLADQTTVGLRIALPGTTFTTSTMTLGSSTGSSLQIDLGTTGNLTAPAFRATTVTANGTTAISLAGPMTPGNFTLIDYSGAIGGAGFGSFSLTLPLRVAGSLVNNTVNTSVDVNILGTDTPKWNGNVNANWDIDDGTGSGTANWKGAFTGNSTRYLQGASGIDAVIFDDTSMRANVDLTTTLTPNGITVNNSTLNYTFGGSGKLSGGATLTKQGSQTLIIANMGANDYTGATTVTAGTLQIGDGTTAGAGQLGSGTVNVEGALVFHRPDDFTVTNAIAGAGTLTKLGAGRTTLIGAITLTGDTTITSGALQIAGTANVPGRVINNATLLLESATPFTGTISGTGTVIARGGGTTQIAGFEANTYTGGTTVSAGLLQLNKTAGVNAIGGNLVMDGTGRVQLLAAEQIPDTASVTFDSNGGNVVFLNETFANLSVINGSETSQFQVQGGFVVTNRLTLTNGLFGVTSGTTDTNVGEVVISGGILRLGANNGISILEVGAGGITATGGLIQVGQGGGTFDAVLNLRGNYTGSGTVEFARGNFFGAEKREINLGDATRTFNVTSDITTIRPDIAGSGGLRKTGAGALALFGANTFTGDTSIEAGTVVLAGSLGATPAITVKSGATLDVTPAAGGLTLAVGQTLKGAGTVVGSVAINGTLAPGEGIGTLTVGGDVTLSGTADFEINKTGLTLNADLASISGSLGFGGTLKVTRAGDILAQGDAFNLFDASSFTGSFLNLDLPALAGGLFWDTGRLPVDGTLAVVPEPGSMAQAMVGVLSLLGFRLRRRSLN